MDESHTGFDTTDWKPNRRFDFCDTNSEEEEKSLQNERKKGYDHEIVHWALKPGEAN